MNINNIENVCKYLQRIDRNGDYLDMISEYKQGDIDLEEIYEVCDSVLNEWKEDLQTITNHTKEDIRDITIIQSYIDSIN